MFSPESPLEPSSSVVPVRRSVLDRGSDMLIHMTAMLSLIGSNALMIHIVQIGDLSTVAIRSWDIVYVLICSDM